MAMRFLHTMIRVRNLEESIHFWCDIMGFVEDRRMNSEAGKFTLVFLSCPGQLDKTGGRPAPEIELTYNWEPEDYGTARNFGHVAIEVDDIYAFCQRVMDAGVVMNRPPRDGRMAFVRSPDLISVEILQKGDAKPVAEPWTSMPNIGVW
jgi:lactoylglutathione lyase